MRSTPAPTAPRVSRSVRSWGGAGVHRTRRQPLFVALTREVQLDRVAVVAVDTDHGAHGNRLAGIRLAGHTLVSEHAGQADGGLRARTGGAGVAHHFRVDGIYRDPFIAPVHIA